MADVKTFETLDALARHFRETNKKVTLIFAHNGTGKTRLSMAFKDLGKNGDRRDTLYFNAFTEDLFTWDNDLEHDSERMLRINTDSRFFDGLVELEMESRIRPLLHRYCDFDFQVDYDNGTIQFWRESGKDADGKKAPLPIKISRGEENIFIWCFFLAIAQLAIDWQEAYDWVKYLYIDDPISSLDEKNAIAVAVHLAKMLKEPGNLKAVISSHHTLFFNVLCNELQQAKRYFLSFDADGWHLHDTGKTPHFYHVAMLKELHVAVKTGKLYTYHFNILRSIMEKSATFHGYNNVGDIIKHDPDDEDGTLHFRYVNLLSHGGYSLFEPVVMMEENKQIFRKILNDFMDKYCFNPELFPDLKEQ